MFAVQDRETVRERFEEMETVHNVGSVGNGLYIEATFPDNTHTFGDVVGDTRWVITMADPEKGMYLFVPYTGAFK